MCMESSSRHSTELLLRVKTTRAQKRNRPDLGEFPKVLLEKLGLIWARKLLWVDLCPIKDMVKS